VSERRGLRVVSLVALLALGLASPRSPTAAQVSGPRAYLPALFTAPATPVGCQAIPGASAAAIPIASAPTNIPAAQDPDLNLDLRGWQTVSGQTLGLVTYNPGGGGPDPNAPQLDSLFTDGRVPTFTNDDAVYDWNWGANARGSPLASPPVTLAGMQVTPGEELLQPRSGYQIYPPSYQTLVLYATADQVTLTYTRNDNIVSGYAIHVEGICVEPGLLALYTQMDGAGRAQLPALAAGEPIGRANGAEIQVAIRDNGTFMDPRSRTDWWQGK
jgi:hypothetical protein